MSAPHLDQLRVSPFYFSAVNALTKPNQMVFCSRYFVRRWMPDLGGTGTQIVLYLRSLGYYNRQTGERRDEISVKLREIAAACRCSAATVRREFSQNEALQLFVQVRPRFEDDPTTGLPRQCENGYRVAMDDPPHQADFEWLQNYISGEEADPGKTTPPQSICNPPPINLQQGGCNLQPPPNQNDWAILNTKESLQNDLIPLNVKLATASPSPSVPKSDAQTFNGSQSVSKSSLRTPDHVRLANQVVVLTNDEKSRKRFEQLAGIADTARAMHLWDAAYKATEARLKKSTEPLEKPGAYFNTLLGKLLFDAGVYVPVGTPEERTDIRAQIKASLAQADTRAAAKVPPPPRKERRP